MCKMHSTVAWFRRMQWESIEILSQGKLHLGCLEGTSPQGPTLSAVVIRMLYSNHSYTHQAMLPARPRLSARHHASLRCFCSQFLSVAELENSILWPLSFWDDFLDPPKHVKCGSVQAIGNNHILYVSYWDPWVSEGSGCDVTYEFPTIFVLKCHIFHLSII